MAKIMNKPADEITIADLESVTTFEYDPYNEEMQRLRAEEGDDWVMDFDTFHPAEIVDISDLCYCINLETLSLSNQPIQSIEALRDLDKLEAVFLHGCTGITDLSPLAGKKRLTDVWINGVWAEDISPIVTLPNLRDFNASWYNSELIWDLAPLADSDSLESFLCDIPVENYAPLLNHPHMRSVALYDLPRELFAEMMEVWAGLEYLSLNNSDITDEDLARIGDKQFKRLMLNNCQNISDLAPLQSQRVLDDLRITNCAVEDI